MKVLTKEESDAHMHYVVSAGAKGFFAGGLLSAGIVAFLKHKKPTFWSSLNASIKTAITIIPITFVGVVAAEEGSTNFERLLYSSPQLQKEVLEEHKRWKELSFQNKTFEILSNNKYKFIIGGWAGSMYGAWKLVDRDPIMTKTQKAVQARMYAQAITVALLLGSVYLSTLESEANKKKPQPEPEWKRMVKEEEARERLRDEKKESVSNA